MSERRQESRFQRMPFDKRPTKTIETVEMKSPGTAGKHARYFVDEVRYPNGNMGRQHRIYIPRSVFAAHMDDDDQLALVTNYRHPLGRYSVELPGGAVDETVESLAGVIAPIEAQELLDIARNQEVSIVELLGSDQVDEVLRRTAARELHEETGWASEPDNFRPLLPGPTYNVPGLVHQPSHIYVGHGGYMDKTNHDDGESGTMTAGRYSLEDAAAMIGHEIVEPATTIAVIGLANMHGKRVSFVKK